MKLEIDVRIKKNIAQYPPTIRCSGGEKEVVEEFIALAQFVDWPLGASSSEMCSFTGNGWWFLQVYINISILSLIL